MKALVRNSRVILLIVFIIILEWYVLRNYYNYIPGHPPTPKISYKDTSIILETTDYNWFDQDIGGNSNIFGPPAEILKDYKPIDVRSGEWIECTFPQKPRIISIIVTKWDNSQWKVVDKYHKFYSDKKELRKISTPQEKGIYIYEVNGEWDGGHNTASIFKINVK